MLRVSLSFAEKIALDWQPDIAYPLNELDFQRFRSPAATIPRSNSRVPITPFGEKGTNIGGGALCVGAGAGGEVGVYVAAVPFVYPLPATQSHLK